MVPRGLHCDDVSRLYGVYAPISRTNSASHRFAESITSLVMRRERWVRVDAGAQVSR